MLKLPAEWDKSLINLSSILGIVGTDRAFSYCGSKGSVTLMTKAVGIHLAQRKTGIRCNSVHPGYVESPMTDAWLNEEYYKSISALHPAGRFATADEVANAIMFLASEESTFCGCLRCWFCWFGFGFLMSFSILRIAWAPVGFPSIRTPSFSRGL
jgi:NAD(P)-dependent dehydrogenase (short-subunit alcohol dehydrogenase family)